MWLDKKLIIFTTLLAVISISYGFRFEQEKIQSEIVKDVEEPVEAKEQPQENEEREERKIEPLVVDIDREEIEKPSEESDIEAKEASEDEGEKIEPRFFLKDKLCALGLADVSKIHEIIGNLAKKKVANRRGGVVADHLLARS